MSDIRHFENGFIAISLLGIIRFQWHLVRRCKFCLSIKILQIQNGGRPPYLKSFLAIYERLIVRLMRNLVWRSKITVRHVKWPKSKFQKFKMADGRHLENVFLLYLSRKSSDFNEIWCADANKCCFRGQPRDNVSNFCKFKMADGRHTEKYFKINFKYWNITKNTYLILNSSTNQSINQSIIKF